ncbi:NAD(P)/FAD-dependent oxidoreductase [Halobacillus mangrovi]|uniref:Oxidoreductase n=1 Tax=Halobacillus mangrovi TaxID=402384 RepID=A0A1W5ZV49_9BACI|nr:FAD-dependent oxidoreductase [Halobacillus mangrovi]ARI77170.1 oxidoreductase [Halobacillus mangrovi]
MKHIIIGAGILGASTAYHLAKEGEEVVIIDRKDPGQATQAGAGIVCPWLTNRSNEAWYRLVLEGARYYPSLIKDLELEGETETGYANVGAINIFDTEEKLNKKMEVANKRKEEAPEMGEITKLSSEETKELYPPVSDKYGSVHISGAARVNGEAVCKALLRAAQKNGAVFINGNAQLEAKGSEVKGVLVNGEKVYSDQVIVTNGAWGRELFSSLDLYPKISFEKAQIVHLKLPGADTEHWPVMLPPFNHYMLAFGNGKVVIGATKEKTNQFDTRVTMGAVHQLLNKALKVAPGLADATYVRTKVGFRPFTPGSLPIIGYAPQYDNILVANGLGASGLTSGPYIGSELAKLAIGRKTNLHLPDYEVKNAFQ